MKSEASAASRKSKKAQNSFTTPTRPTRKQPHRAAKGKLEQMESPDSATKKSWLLRLRKFKESEAWAHIVQEAHPHRSRLDLWSASLLVEAYCRCWRGKDAMDLLLERIAEAKPLDAWAYNYLVAHYAAEGPKGVDKAATLVTLMNSQGVESDANTHTLMFAGACMANEGNRAGALLRSLPPGMKINHVACTWLLAWLPEEKDKTLVMLRGMEDLVGWLDVRTYATIVAGYCKAGHVVAAADVVAHFHVSAIGSRRRGGGTPYSKVYLPVHDSFLAAGNETRAKEIAVLAAAAGVKFSKDGETPQKRTPRAAATSFENEQMQT